MFLPALQPFKLDIGWLRAQAFRWAKHGDWHYGVVRDSPIKVRPLDDGIEFRSDASDEAMAPHVSNYFRLDEDITPIQEALRGLDDTMAGLVEKYDGMRILKQDPWECLAAYICSQNNDIDGITKIVENLATTYGAPLELDGVRLRAFPTPRRLSAAGPAALDKQAPGLGRGSRIHEVATDIAEGRLDLHALAGMRHQQAKAVLMSYDGIGQKIADCVSLFALDNSEAFPVDRHIEKQLEPYGQTHTAGAANARLMQWARRTFGANAGYASQLLFLEGLSKA